MSFTSLVSNLGVNLGVRIGRAALYAIALGSVLMPACATSPVEDHLNNFAADTIPASVRLTVTNDWGAGFVGEVAITNSGSAPIQNWILEFELAGQISNLWNGTFTVSGGRYEVHPVSWNASIAPGQTATIGFVAASQGPRVLAACTLNGIACSAGGSSPQPPPSSPQPPPSSPQPPPSPQAPQPSGDADTIYGQVIPRAESYWTQGGRIYDGGQEIRLYGINWFGLETPERAPHGLWTGRSMSAFLQDIKGVGLNALRVPVSLESIRPGYAAAAWARQGSIDTGREVLEELLRVAESMGIYVLLDIHTCDPAIGGGAAPGPESCPGYTRADWLADLERLAELSLVYDNIMGIDLFNEPHGLTWQGWSALASAGGEAVLRKNPRILVFVEGVGDASNAGGFAPFWGENLVSAVSQPVPLPPSRLVYSPHVYGPGVFNQPYFQTSAFPGNMPAIWDTHFGHARQAGYTLAVGEFGGFYDSAHAGDVTWQQSFADYLVARDIRHFFYWALNPNSGDTGGLYTDTNWSQLHTGKVALLSNLIQRLNQAP